MDISVIIPAFNEEEVIENTVYQIQKFLNNNFDSFEIIVVDDKSTDSTLEILKNISGIKVLRNLKNHGKGYTVAKGIKKATGNLLLFMDADNSTKIEELSNFLREINNYDILIASRALPDSKVEISQNIFKSFLGRIGNFFSRILIDKNILDTQCGFKLFKAKTKHLFDKLTIDGFAFDFELIFLARKYKFRVKEMPVVWKNNFNSTVRWYDYPKTMLSLVGININNLLGKYN